MHVYIIGTSGLQQHSIVLVITTRDYFINIDMRRGVNYIHKYKYLSELIIMLVPRRMQWR